MKKLTFLTAILLATTTFAQVPNYVPTNGLVGWWPFNGNANDESGNGNNGTVNGATLTSDRNGVTNNAYDFNGNGDFINCGNLPSLNITESISISVWLKISDFNNDHGIVSKSGLFDLITNSNNSTPPLDKIRWNAGNSFLFSGPSIQLNQWIHITSVYNHLSGHEIYMNGILVSSDNITGSVQPNTTYDLYLGSHQPFNVNYWSWSGKLDDIGIWNRALTDCEIKDLYNSQLGSSNTISSQTQTALDTYTWPVNNQTYTQSGTYSDTLVNAAGCDSIVTLNLTLSYTGINELNASQLVVSPNPTRDNFSITGLELLGTITSLEIKDAAGKVVKVLNPTATNFSCVGLKAGVYFLAVTSNKTERVIKIIKE
jgi:hypothetical protein